MTVAAQSSMLGDIMTALGRAVALVQPSETADLQQHSGWLTAQGSDPHLIYTAKATVRRWLILELESAGPPLDPRIFIDYGRGFTHRGEYQARKTGHGIYVVAMPSFSRISRVRLDPASTPCQVKIQAYEAIDERSALSFVTKRCRELDTGKGIGRTCEIIMRGPSGPWAGIARRLRPPGGLRQHFKEVVHLAAEKYRNPQFEIPDVPIISFVVPTYNTKPQYLNDLLASLTEQSQAGWELILSDDGSTSKQTLDWLSDHENVPSLRIKRNSDNMGITSATNSGLSVARGEWVGLIDHDDALAPFAIAAIMEAIHSHPNAQFVYTDELIVDKHLKPEAYFLRQAFDPVILSGMNYINHLSLYRRSRLAAIGALRTGFDGSQDYDLLLRYLSGLPASSIVHVPYPAYLWRRDGSSYSITFVERAVGNARKALTQHFSKSSVPLAIDAALHPTFHRVRFDRNIREWPSVSVVIPNRDSWPLISRLIHDLEERTDYPQLEVIIVDNGSSDEKVLALYSGASKRRLRMKVDIQVEGFNFSRMINRGCRLATGRHILLLNNDIEVIDPEWLKEMVSCLCYPSAGIVGARLLYPNGRLQHAGVIVGLGSAAGHWFCGDEISQIGPMGRLTVRQTFSATTAACMLISRSCLDSVGEFDEADFGVAYNDVDYCLRAGALGFRVVWTPFATLYHHESASRGSDDLGPNAIRFRREQEKLRSRYQLFDFCDAAYNPWFARDSGQARLGFPEQLPVSRNGGRFEGL